MTLRSRVIAYGHLLTTPESVLLHLSALVLTVLIPKQVVGYMEELFVSMFPPMGVLEDTAKSLVVRLVTAYALTLLMGAAMLFVGRFIPLHF